MARKSTDERRAQISQALLQAMAEHGYAKATIAKIAEQADVTPGLIHYHFDTKQAILLDLLGRLVTRQQEMIDARLEAADGPLEQLDGLVDAFLALGEQARPEAVASWVTMATEAIRQPEVQQAFAKALHSFAEVFEEAIAAGVDDGTFHLGALSAPACAAAILATIQGYFTLAATERELIPSGSAAPATRRMLRGLLGLDASS
ncbi:MAG: TetR/AcrR family transcriptional regulator [Persicimonas sp.]